MSKLVRCDYCGKLEMEHSLEIAGQGWYYVQVGEGYPRDCCSARCLQQYAAQPSQSLSSFDAYAVPEAEAVSEAVNVGEVLRTGRKIPLKLEYRSSEDHIS